MKSLHIRDVDPFVLQRLQILAQLHHRSMQGEVRAILAEAAQRAPTEMVAEQLPILTVETGGLGTFSRDEIYDDAR